MIEAYFSAGPGRIVRLRGTSRGTGVQRKASFHRRREIGFAAHSRSSGYRNNLQLASRPWNNVTSADDLAPADGDVRVEEVAARHSISEASRVGRHRAIWKRRIVREIGCRVLSQQCWRSMALGAPPYPRRIQAETQGRLMAPVDHFNRHPVVHTWTYNLDRAADMIRSLETMH